MAMKREKGITLIALVITIIILLILASIAMASLFGENGVISKTVKARDEHNLNQYKEEIGLIVAEEITQRQTEEKLEPMIKSLEDKIKQKDWVKEKGTSKYNKHMIPITDEQAQEGKYLIIESKEGYEFILEVDNEKETAKLITANKKAGKKYKITYDLNGGEGEIPSRQEVRQGSSVLLPENTVTKQDYIFVGWSTDKSGNGTNILLGEVYTPQEEKEEITLYAIWSYNVVTITFDGNGATGGSMESQIVKKGQSVTLKRNTFTKEGFWFGGWTLSTGGTSKDYDNGASIPNLESDLTLYAIWWEAFDASSLTIGNAINSDKYGWRVPKYTVKTDGFTTGVWRLFYQDNNYTYLITDECVGNYKPSNYYSSYASGADVSEVGQKLNPMISSLFKTSNSNIRATAWLTDPVRWMDYTNDDAVFAIGSPTLELFAASYNATGKSVTITPSSNGYDGYEVYPTWNVLSPDDNHGIYSKSRWSDWWLASPDQDPTRAFMVSIHLTTTPKA